MTSAIKAHLWKCHGCGRLCDASNYLSAIHLNCTRCQLPLHPRKVNSLQRTWAFLISAIVAYVPANLLPMMKTYSIAGIEDDTIMSGVAYLWSSGSWPLAAVVFTASIMVPLFKICTLLFLLLSVQRGSQWAPLERTRLYRLVEVIGPWSMLDIFVVALMACLVQWKSLATIHAGPAAIAFGAVVVFTMLAAMSFDPRLIWDQIKDKDA